jgi:hypothetical protein
MVGAWPQERKEAATAHDICPLSLHASTLKLPLRHSQIQTYKMQTNDPKTDNPSASVETMDVWAFHDVFGVPHGELPAPVKMPEGLEEAFAKMLEGAKAADEASAAVSVFSRRHPSARHVG